MTLLLSRLCYLTLIFLCFGASARADFFIHVWQDHHDQPGVFSLGLNGNYYTAINNFSDTGVIVTPSGLTTYSRSQADADFNYGLSDQITLFGRLSWAYVNQIGLVQPGSGFGFADQTVGVNYQIYQDNLHPRLREVPPLFIRLQLQTDFPGYSTAASQTSLTPFIGDGTLDITGGGFLTVPVFPGKAATFLASFGTGLTYRNANFSAAIPISTSIQYMPYHKGVFADFSGFGTVSLGTDPTPSSGKVRSSQGSSGLFFTGATNPSQLLVRGRVGYLFNDATQVFASVTETVWGYSVPDALNFALGFQTRFGISKKNQSTINSKTESAENLDYTHSNKGFLRYTNQAHILKANDRLNLVKIDKGRDDNVAVGQTWDIFSVKNDGKENEVVARGKVSSVKPGESVLEVVEFYKEVWIDEGFIAKHLIETEGN